MATDARNLGPGAVLALRDAEHLIEELKTTNARLDRANRQLLADNRNLMADNLALRRRVEELEARRG